MKNDFDVMSKQLRRIIPDNSDTLVFIGIIGIPQAFAKDAETVGNSNNSNKYQDHSKMNNKSPISSFVHQSQF